MKLDRGRGTVPSEGALNLVRIREEVARIRARKVVDRERAEAEADADDVFADRVPPGPGLT